MIGRLLICATLLLMTQGGCRDDAAPGACRQVIDAWCGRFASCFEEADREGCNTMAAASMGDHGCAAASAVRDPGEVAECRAAVEALTCDSLRAMPSVCDGLFLH